MIAPRLKVGASALGIFLGSCLCATLASAQTSQALLAKCLSAPSSEFIGFDQDGADIVAAQRGPFLQQRYVTNGSVRFTVPPRSSGAIIRHAGPLPGVLLLMDKDGNERYGLFYQDPTKSAPPTRISPLGARTAAPFTLPSRGATIFTSTAGNGPIWGVLEHRPSEGLRVLFQEAGAWQAMNASEDGRRVLLQETFGLYDRVLYVFDRPSGIKIPVFVGPRPLAVRGAAISPDGAYVYAIIAFADQGGLLIRSQISTGIITQLLETTWPLYSMTLSSDGSTLTALENQNGRTALHTLALGSDGLVSKRPLDGWTTYAVLNHDGTRLGMTYEQPGVPAKAVTLPVKAAETQASDVIISPAPCANASMTALNIPRRAAVGEQGSLPAFLIEPQRRAARPRPLLIAFHGGPEGQWRASSHLELFALAQALDIAILLPNVVGSTGYGLRYAAADDRARRAQVTGDVALILDWAAEEERFNPGKIALFGASYGGYLALYAQSQFNDKFAGAISEVGISDFPSFLSETPLTRRSLRRAEYGDERDEDLSDALKELSPLTHVQNITKPVFLAHGVNDARVPVNQSTKIAEALTAQETPVTYEQIPNEGHVIRNVETRITLALKKADFLKALFGNAGPDARQAP